MNGLIRNANCTCAAQFVPKTKLFLREYVVVFSYEMNQISRALDNSLFHLRTAAVPTAYGELLYWLDTDCYFFVAHNALVSLGTWYISRVEDF